MPEHTPAPSAEPHHPAGRWSLPDDPDLGWLRTQAKLLRRAYADPAHARHDEAVDLVTTYDPGDGPVALARAQRVLARAFGFAGWSKLREHLATIDTWSRPMESEVAEDGPVDRFLRLACLSYSEPEVAEEAVALLRESPDLATTSAYTMAATGRADDLAEALAAGRVSPTEEGGPHRWPPLLYLCYSRLGLVDHDLGGDPVRTARVLLDAGADPNSGFLWHGLTSPFTALTGVLGGGERGESQHPQEVALAELLLDAGADPNDNQALYNRMFQPLDTHLPPLLAHGLGGDRPSPWRDRLGSAYPSPEEMVGEHLRSAAEKGYTNRVRLLLAHGVDPNTRGYHPILGDQTAYEIAVRNGQAESAALLVEAGGASRRIDDVDRLLSAAMVGDEATVAALRSRAAEAVVRRPGAMVVAAELHGRPALERLLDLGFPVDAHGKNRRTALHEAALAGDVELCRWLVQQGARRTIKDRMFSSTPAGWAAHAGHADLAAELEP